MKYFTEDVILKFQRGGSNNKGKGKKDDKKGKKKTNNSGNSQPTTTSTSNYRTYTGPTTWMPQPIQPVIDNTGGLGYADNYNRRQTQLVEARQREAEAAARRNQPTILEDRRTPYEIQLSEQYKRMTTPGTVEYARANNGYYLWYSDPNGTGAMQTATNYTIPAAGQAWRQYWDRLKQDPIGTLGEDVVRSVDNISRFVATTPAAPVMEAQAFRQSVNEGNGWDAAQHAIMLGLTSAPFLRNVHAPSLLPVTRATQATRQVIQNVGDRALQGLRSFGDRMVEGVNATGDILFGPRPQFQPVFATAGNGPRVAAPMVERTAPAGQMNMWGKVGKGGFEVHRGSKPAQPTSTETPHTAPEFKYRGDLYSENGYPLEIYREVKQEIPESYWNPNTNQWTAFPLDITFNGYADIPVSEHTSATGVKFIKQPSGKYKVIDENGIAQSLELTSNEIQQMYSETIPTENLREYTSPDGKVFGHYREQAVKGQDTKYSYEKVKMNEAIDPTETYYTKDGYAYSPNAFYNSEGRAYKNWRTGELFPENESWWRRNKGKVKNGALWTLAGSGIIGTFWGLNKVPQAIPWLWNHDYDPNRQQQITDSIQRSIRLNDSIQAAERDSIEYNNKLSQQLNQADSLMQEWQKKAQQR